MGYDSLIFDLDGTLWNSSNSVASPWNVVLERKVPTSKKGDC